MYTLHFPHFERSHFIGTLEEVSAELTQLFLVLRMGFPRKEINGIEKNFAEQMEQAMHRCSPSKVAAENLIGMLMLLALTFQSLSTSVKKIPFRGSLHDRRQKYYEHTFPKHLGKNFSLFTSSKTILEP